MVIIGGHKLQSGDRIICTLRGFEITDAKIHFDENTINRGTIKAWICHNNPNAIGDISPVLYDYTHSWTFYIDGDYTSDEVSSIRPLLPHTELKKDVDVDIDLLHFLGSNEWHKLVPLFYYKLGIFDDFNKYEMSKTDGCIILKNDRKSLEIRLSRFIRQMSNSFDIIVSKNDGFQKLDINDKTIEGIYNKFVSYQKSDNFVISFFTGEDILKGYDRNNYHPKSGGSLHQSCMVDKFEFLKIYTKNPNQIKLAVIHIDNKIAARGLVWTNADGEMFSDRVYYNHDWLEQFMREKLRKLGILPIVENPNKAIKLEEWKFDYYPYADTFYYLDYANGILMNFHSSDVRTLRNTGGNLG